MIINAIEWGKKAVADGSDLEARTQVQWASIVALNGWVQAGVEMLPPVHMIEHALSAHHDITHGAGLAILNPAYMRFIANARPERLAQFATRIFGLSEEGKDQLTLAMEGIDAFEAFLFAIAQLIWGPVSDNIGRRIPLFIGMVVFAMGSAGCALSESIGQIVFWRLFQAFGACTGPMLAWAMVRDLFSRTRSAQALSTLMIIMAIAPIIGPLLGGQILRFSTWHSIFWLLTVIGMLMFMSRMRNRIKVKEKTMQKRQLGNSGLEVSATESGWFADALSRSRGPRRRRFCNQPHD